MNVATTQYEYAEANRVNSMAFSFPGQSKATAAFGLIGTDTPVPTSSQASGNRLEPYLTDAFNTSSDIARLILAKADETGLTSYFKSLDLTIENNVSPEKTLGTLGATFMNFGDFVVTGSAQILFTSTDVVTAIRDNETVAMYFSIGNDDGTLYFDIPSMTLGSGTKGFPRNETVTIDISSTAFEDDFFGYCLGITEFPYVPRTNPY